jgi:error-prone DNA polymerase
MLLNCHSYFSMRYGVMKPEDLVQEVLRNGYTQCALTDINNTSAAWDFVRIARKNGLQPKVGIDFRNGAQPCYVGLAKNKNGFFHLNKWLSEHLHEAKKFDPIPPLLPDCFFVLPFEQALQHFSEDLPENVYIGLHPSDIGNYKFSSLRSFSHRLVVLATFTFRNKKDFNAHRLLRAIDNNLLLSLLPKSEEADASDVLFSPSTLHDAFSEFPDLIVRTEALLSACSICLEEEEEGEITNKNLQLYTDHADTDAELIKQLCFEGLHYRYPELAAIVTTRVAFESTTTASPIIDRIHKELSIIREKGYLSYFLINWDITRYARSKGYFYVGRGSGANSIVAYLLRITDVDPIELDLYFERFINLYRKNPPDFDIDFSWTDRDDITNYIFQRFPHCALLGAYNTFQYRAVVRELGKVFGLPKSDIDVLSDGKFDPHRLDSSQRLVLNYSQYIQDFPNMVSIHSAGILIADHSLHHYSATFFPPKGFPTVQFDMLIAEDIGLYKFDILSQRGLGKIKDCLAIVAYNQPDVAAFDIHDMRRFKQDERIKKLLREAKAIGCFYVESPAMRMLMTKLQVDDYLGLVAASSIIRPGVSNSGMMREYILRHRHPERRKEAHPVLLDIMPDTYGVMVYQEDVIKVAHLFGGLSLAEADSLRRGMSGKFRGREEFDQARSSFFKGATAQGHPIELAGEIWRQIESFAGYAFAKGHSASYAVESFQSLFLKAYFPLEYMTATINNFGGFYSTEFYVHEARMHGATIEAPCVNRGSIEAVLYDTTLVLGMGLVKDLELGWIEKIIAERKLNGLYLDLNHFIERTYAPLAQLTVLIRIGAFRFTGRNKKDLLWEAHLTLNGRTTNEHAPELFQAPVRQFELPPLHHSWIEDAYDEWELIGFPLCNPFLLLPETHSNDVLAREIPQHLGQLVWCTGYLITSRPTRTAKGEQMMFGNFVDAEGHFLDTVHFPPVAKAYPFKGRGMYRFKGKVMEEFGAYTIEVHHLEKLAFESDPRYASMDSAHRLRMMQEIERNNSSSHLEESTNKKTGLPPSKTS